MITQLHYLYLIPDLYVFHNTLASAEPINLGSTDQGSVLGVGKVRKVKLLHNQKLSLRQLLLCLIPQEANIILYYMGVEVKR